MLRWPLVSPEVLGALAVAAACGWLLWWSPTRARLPSRRPRSRVLLAVALTLSLLAAADLVNAYFDYLPQVGDVTSLASGPPPWDVLQPGDLEDPSAAQRHPGGGVLTLPVPDGDSGLGRGPALVWLPVQYLRDRTRRFPVVYLFHGSPGAPADWLRGGRAADTARELAARGLPAVVVMPQMSRDWLDDPECVDGVSERAETHFWRDVVPTVDATLRTVPTRDARALAGMSAGGYCALNLGLKHRAQVSTVLDLSGLTSPTHRGGLSVLYGHDARARAARDDPARYVAHLSADPPTRVWLDTGTADTDVRPGLEALAPRLADRGLEVALHLRPGGHTFHVWQPALADALAWALPAMTRAAESQPTSAAR